MAKKLYDETNIQDIANAIRGQNGSTDKYTTAQMAAAISALTTGDIISQADIPDYVKAEAADLVNKVRAVQGNNTVTFIAMADSHHLGSQTSSNQTNINTGNLHAGMAAKALAYLLDFDFACYLGDYSYGNPSTTAAQVKEQITGINSYINEAFAGLPQFRTVGNHDTGEYNEPVSAADLFTLIGSYCQGATYGSNLYGYCYRDFPSKKLRVICLNTSEGETVSGTSATDYLSDTQLLWFAQTLADIGDENDWSIIVLGHCPIDYGKAYKASNTVYQYLNGGSVTYNGTTVSFSGHNSAKFIAQFHGHIHNYKVDNLHRISNGTGIAYDAWRACVPNSCFYRSNEFGENDSPDSWGIEFGETVTFNKTANTANDTAFVVNVIDPTREVIYSFAYGAGYDRVISYGSTVYHSVSYNLSHVTSDNNALSIESGEAYTATIEADSGYDITAVVVTMGGIDITSTAYNSSTGIISIASVTGNVVITATAARQVSYTNLVPISTDSSGNVFNGTGYIDGYRISSSGTESASSGCTSTGFIPFTAGQKIRLAGSGISFNAYGDMIYFYDSQYNPRSSAGIAYNRVGDSEYGVWDTSENTAFTVIPDSTSSTGRGTSGFIRISCHGSGANMIVTLDEIID